MTKRLISRIGKTFGWIFPAFLFLCAASTLTYAQAIQPRNPNPGNILRTPVQRLAAFSHGSLKLSRAHSDGSPSIIVASPNLETPIFDTRVGRSSNATVTSVIGSYAQSFIANLMPLTSELSILQTATRRVGDVWQSTFMLNYAGIPLLERNLKIIAGAKNGKIMYIENTLPINPPAIVRAAISPEQATNTATAYLNQQGPQPTAIDQPKLAFIISGASVTPRLIYQVIGRAEFRSMRLWIDASNGDIIKVKDLDEYNVSGGEPRMPQTSSSGKVTVQIHPQSPYDSLVTVPLPHTTILVNSQRAITDSLGNWLIAGVLPPLSIITNFSNPNYFTEDTIGGTKNSSMVVKAYSDTTLNWNDSNSNAAERDAYYHVGYAEQYVLNLDSTLSKGFADALTVNVNVHAICNAFYNPDLRSVNFFHSGGGCSNTGEIADIVFHEFGHRVADIRYTASSGANIVDGSLSEGFADLVSAFMRDDPRIGIDFFGKGTILRTCDNSKKWPQDLNPDIHITGEIISGAFWDLREAIGHDTAESLFHKMEYLHPDGTDEINPAAMQDAFVSVLMALLTADDTDNDLSNGTPHAAQILHAFSLHNIGLSPFITVLSTPLLDQDTVQNGYEVAAEVLYSGQIGTIDSSGVLLRYTTDDWATSTQIAMKQLGEDSFSCTIPKQSAGAVVQYIISAATIYPDAGEGYAPSAGPFTSFSFLVGYKQTFLDDAEQDRGWSLSQPSDNALTGLWTRDVPYGTYIVPDEFVQQDTDHTANGTMCYLTGNRNASGHSRNVSDDDVDSGVTTLTTPIYDLSKLNNPAIRFWYYYSNNAGANPGENSWKVLISSDGGATWKYMLFTFNSTMGWTPYLFKVSDYVIPSSEIQLRFVASDTIGAVVEAGVDDLTIFEAPTTESVIKGSSDVAPTFGLGIVRPNPLHTNTIASARLSLPNSEHVVLQIKDVLGRILQTPFDHFANRGTFDLSFATAGLPSGMYWLQLSANEGTRIRSFTVAH